MGQAHHRNIDPQVQRRTGWIEFARGCDWRRSRHARRSQRAVFNYGGLHQAHTARPRRHRQRIQETWPKTTGWNARRIALTLTTKVTKVTKVTKKNFAELRVLRVLRG